MTEALLLAVGLAIGLGAGWSIARRRPRRDVDDALPRVRREAEASMEALRRDREIREAILGSMEEGVILIGPTGDIGYLNPSARRLVGAASSGRGLAPAALQRLVDEARADASLLEREVETGVPARVLRASALSLGDHGVLVVLRDVTAARRVEAMRRDFVADASHELKTPAASIQAAAETVERAIAEDPEAAVRFARRVRREAVRLSRIVSDLLDLSRLETERPGMEPVELDRVIRAEVDRLQGLSRETGVEMEVVAAPVTVAGSARDLALLARNLLDNALRYTPSGGRVHVRVGTDRGRALLSVVDTGPGIPSRDLPRIFERFYRVDRARSRETGGTGLGLSIARHVAEQHGGAIEAESELGRGSTFRVTLPLDGHPAA